MAQQTAVEYLVEQLFPKALSAEQYYHIEQAKEMEKQQIIDAYDCALFGHGINGEPCASGGKYYTETYTTRLQNETN
jgi:capsid portal protein